MPLYAIPISPISFQINYPTVKKTRAKTKAGDGKIILNLKDPGGSLNGELDGWATALINQNPTYTTCCMQMSHAINMAFLRYDTMMVGARSHRRDNHRVRIKSAANKQFYYIASVDEMKDFLDETFEPGLAITSKDDIKDQPGIVVFMGTGLYAGIHTEIWTGSDFHQDFMKGRFSELTKPKVWFWNMGDPGREKVRYV